MAEKKGVEGNRRSKVAVAVKVWSEDVKANPEKFVDPKEFVNIMRELAVALAPEFKKFSNILKDLAGRLENPELPESQKDDKIVENERDEGDAWGFAEAMTKVWSKGDDLMADMKKFERFLNTMRKLAEKLDTLECKELSNMLKELAGILEDGFERSKIVKAVDLFRGLSRD